MRRVNKMRWAFASDDAAAKPIWLTMRNVTTRWALPVAHWKPALRALTDLRVPVRRLRALVSDLRARIRTGQGQLTLFVAWYKWPRYGRLTQRQAPVVCSAFDGHRLLTAGLLEEVARSANAAFEMPAVACCCSTTTPAGASTSTTRRPPTKRWRGWPRRRLVRRPRRQPQHRPEYTSGWSSDVKVFVDRFAGEVFRD